MTIAPDSSGRQRTLADGLFQLRRAAALAARAAPWLRDEGVTLLPASVRRQTLTALRSLFGHCKKTGRIFRDPTRGVRDGQRPLAAGHAARPKTTRELHLDDIDLGNRRLVRGIDRVCEPP